MDATDPSPPHGTGRASSNPGKPTAKPTAEPWEGAGQWPEEAPTPPAPTQPPPTTPSTADRIALAAVWALPPTGALIEALSPGALVYYAVVWSPLLLGFLVTGLVLFTRTLRRRSPVRALHGRVPGVYHRLAWAWGLTWVLPPLVLIDGGEPLVLTDGGDQTPWTSPLLQILGIAEPGWYYELQWLTAVAVAVLAVGVTVDIWRRYRATVNRLQSAAAREGMAG